MSSPLLERVLTPTDDLTCEVKFPHLDEAIEFRFKRISAKEVLRLKSRREVADARMHIEAKRAGNDMHELVKLRERRENMSDVETLEAAVEMAPAIDLITERNERLAAECITLSLETGKNDAGEAHPQATMEQAYSLLVQCGGANSELAQTALAACGVSGPQAEDATIDLPA